MIQAAVDANELRESDNGYEIVREGPGTGDLWQALRTKLFDLIRNEENRVIQSPTSSGKTHTISTTRWRSFPEVTGGQPVILFSGTKSARDDAVAKSQQSHASWRVLRGREDACPIAAGEYDSGNNQGNPPISAPDGSEPSDWFKSRCKDGGLHFSIAHGEFERFHEEDLPCGEGRNGSCTSSSQWEGLPRDVNGEVDYDVLHATHQFALTPQLIEDNNLIFDELPDFSLNIKTGGVRKLVNSYLDEIDAHIESWEELLVGITGSLNADLDRLRDELGMPDPEWFLQADHAHALSPGIVEAIVTAEERNHNRWVGTAEYTYPTLNPNHEGPKQSVTIRIVIEDESNNVRLLQVVPDLSQARSVIGLDAHPTMLKWQAYTLSGIGKDEIVRNEEFHKWRRNQRNLRIVQVGDNKNTWTKTGFNDAKVRVLSEELRHKYGNGFRTGITSKRFEDDLQGHLSEAGVASPETIYYGIEKSVDNFDSEPAGLIAGCISPSDKHVKDWMALFGKDADPAREIDDIEREGQIWIGPDADVAHQLIQDVREKKVLQACGRYARSPQQPTSHSTVYVLTNVIPNDYVDEKIDGVQVFGKKKRQILNYIASHGGMSPSEITKEAEATKRYVHDVLSQVRDYPWIDLEETEGSNQPTLYSAHRSPSGYVEV